MGRAPCCDKANVKKGPWSPEEDAKLKDFIEKFGTCGNWISLPQKAGLKRCGKSCRLRWLNYLRPNIKHGEFTDEEDRIICTLYASIGSRWSIIAGQLPGRTDNDIKNYWNTKLKKKLMMGINNIPSKLFSPSPSTTQFHQPLSNLYNNYSSFHSQNTKFLNPINENPQNYLFTLPSTNMSYNFQQNQEGTNFLDFQQSNNMLMFGGNNEASCSNSSDGSFINKEIKHEDHIGGFMEDQNHHKFMHHYNEDYPLSGFVDQKQENGILGELGYNYEIEEVNKQVFNSGNFWLNDENKKVMNMYYYH